MTTYIVEILLDAVERPHLRHEVWGYHSSHKSYREAVDQSDMVHGRVIVGEGGTGCMTDKEAHQWAVENQGYDGDYLAWSHQDDEDRAEYEDGAAGIPTG